MQRALYGLAMISAPAGDRLTNVTKSDIVSSTMEPANELYVGLIRLHILHHAAEGDLFGFGMIQELRRHGYELSPGTLYPILHRMEQRGYIASRKKTVAGRVRRVYRATAAGRKALDDAKHKVRELFSELVEGA